MITRALQIVPGEGSIRNLTSQLWPAAVHKVWPGSAHTQLDEVRDDAVEREGEGDHEAGRGQVHHAAGRGEHGEDGGERHEAHRGPQQVGGHVGVGHRVPVEPDLLGLDLAYEWSPSLQF